MIKKRLAKLRKALKDKSLDGLLVSLPANRRYLSGFTPDDGQLGESSGFLLISQKKAWLLTDFRYELTAQNQAPLFETLVYKKGFGATLAGVLKDQPLDRLGFEAEALLVAQHQRLAKDLEKHGVNTRLTATEGLVSMLRAVKDPQEIKALEGSLAIMEVVLGKVLGGKITGRTERQLAGSILQGLEQAGAQGPAFDPIVAAGPNAAEPHAEPTDHKLKDGEPVIFDVGAKLHGYCSDISRTVVAGGLKNMDRKFRQVYPLVRKAQLAAIEGIRPGMTGQEADAIARKIIDEAGYGQRFGHSLGHGVGLATHEAPSVGPNAKQTLETGMIFTIEPGIYLPGWGGVRLEQMVELTAKGCRLLNHLDCFYAF